MMTLWETAIPSCFGAIAAMIVYLTTVGFIQITFKALHLMVFPFRSLHRRNGRYNSAHNAYRNGCFLYYSMVKLSFLLCLMFVTFTYRIVISELR